MLEESLVAAKKQAGRSLCLIPFRVHSRSHRTQAHGCLLLAVQGTLQIGRAAHRLRRSLAHLLFAAVKFSWKSGSSVHELSLPQQRSSSPGILAMCRAKSECFAVFRSVARHLPWRSQCSCRQSRAVYRRLLSSLAFRRFTTACACLSPPWLVT